MLPQQGHLLFLEGGETAAFPCFVFPKAPGTNQDRWSISTCRMDEIEDMVPVSMELKV